MNNLYRKDEKQMRNEKGITLIALLIIIIILIILTVVIVRTASNDSEQNVTKNSNYYEGILAYRIF